jgi:hypothetical protein
MDSITRKIVSMKNNYNKKIKIKNNWNKNNGKY